MKPSKAATNLVRLILSGNDYDINDRVLDIEFTARLIDEHVKGLVVSLKGGRDCIESNFDPGPIPAFEPTDRDLDVGFAIANADAALKPWTEPAE